MPILYAYILEVRKLVRVVIIAKTSKDNYDKAISFRPISLISFLLKTGVCSGNEVQSFRYQIDNDHAKRKMINSRIAK